MKELVASVWNRSTINSADIIYAIQDMKSTGDTKVVKPKFTLDTIVAKNSRIVNKANYPYKIFIQYR